MHTKAPHNHLKRATSGKRHIFSWILIGIILICAIIFRFYKLPETIQFYDDQGLDMVSILQMEQTGELPLVGPFLSIPDVYTPPTYYMITQFFYNITRTVVGIVYAYALLNLIAVIVLVWVARAMMGMRAAIIISILLATSNVMIDHSRYFWQPHPMQLFLALWILFLWWAYKTKHVFFLISATLWYQVALSIYPSPIILLPLAGYLIFSWFRIVRKSSVVISLCLTGALFAAAFAAVFSSQILFETSRGFPTLQSIFLTPKTLQAFRPFAGISENITAFVTSFFASTRLPQASMIATTTTLCITTFILYLLVGMHRTRHTHPVFWPLWAFVLGFGVFAFVPLEANFHRSAALLPLAFLFFADLLSRAFQNNMVTRTLGILLLGSYVILNLHSAKWYWNGEAANGVDRTKRIAQYILTDMRQRNIPDTSVEFFYKIPNDPENGSYGIYRILFWLMRDGGLSYPLSKNNFYMPHNYSNLRHKPYVYIICRGFTSPHEIEKQCIRPVITPHTYRQVGGTAFGNSTVVILRNEDGTTLP